MKNFNNIFEEIINVDYNNIINELATTYSEEQVNSMESYSLYFHFDKNDKLVGDVELARVTDETVSIPNDNGGCTYVISLPLYFITNYLNNTNGVYSLDKLGVCQWIEDSIGNSPFSDSVYPNNSDLSSKLHIAFTDSHITKSEQA